MHSLFIGCLLLLSVTSVGTIPLLSCTTAKNLTRREGSRELVMSPDDLRKMEREILQLINKHRLGKNLAALNMDGEIAASALSHSKNMADGKVPFGHDGFSERVAGLRKQINGADSWAENVAYNQKSAAEVVQSWLNSPGHRRNIEDNYNITGIGVAMNKSGELYFTQIFTFQKK